MFSIAFIENRNVQTQFCFHTEQIYYHKSWFCASRRKILCNFFFSSKRQSGKWKNYLGLDFLDGKYLRRIIFSWMRMFKLRFSISTVTPCLWHDSNCIRALNPSLDRKYKIITTSCIFNCTEFGTIKIRIIKRF